MPIKLNDDDVMMAHVCRRSPAYRHLALVCASKFSPTSSMESFLFFLDSIYRCFVFLSRTHKVVDLIVHVLPCVNVLSSRLIFIWIQYTLCGRNWPVCCYVSIWRHCLLLFFLFAPCFASLPASTYDAFDYRTPVIFLSP